MNRRRTAMLLAAVLLAAGSVPARAEDSTERRLQVLEEQLKTALTQLDEQRAATQQAQHEIRELRRQLAGGRVGTTAAARAVPAPETDRAIEDKVKAEVARSQEENRQKQQQLEAQVAQMKPAWDDYAKRFLDKFRISTLFYGDWAFYEKTGFGPQFLTQINPPGPGNDNYNSFDITRTYVNLFFTPDEDVTFRVTPNIFRTVGKSDLKNGKSGGVGSNLDGDLSFRLKYAYIDWNTPFAKLERWVPAVAPLAEDKLTFGQQPNPLVDWEENLYGYRFTSLTPWNYASLSSTYTGIAMKGPVKFDGKQFFDYDLGVYNNSNFHQTELSETKTGMIRTSYYPLGARSRFGGLGITGFYDYGFPNKTPDSGPQNHLSRLAALLHYTTDWWGIAGEYDQGKNAFTSSNLFSGSGPADQFGFGPTEFAAFDGLVKAIQDGPHTKQQGFDVFGHVDIPSTPFSLFALYQWLQPNTLVDKNPIDFQRYVAGVGYKYSKYLRFALDMQGLDYYHKQFDFPAAEAQRFGLKAGVPDAVPDGIRAVFLNVEFNY